MSTSVAINIEDGSLWFEIPISILLKYFDQKWKIFYVSLIFFLFFSMMECQEISWKIKEMSTFNRKLTHHGRYSEVFFCFCLSIFIGCFIGNPKNLHISWTRSDQNNVNLSWKRIQDYWRRKSLLTLWKETCNLSCP